MIYFLKERSFNGKIKIGYSNNIQDRLENLQVANSKELIVLLAAEGGARTEKNLHQQFKHLKIRGEWFEPAEELLNFIDQMKKAGLNLAQPSSAFRLVPY